MKVGTPFGEFPFEFRRVERREGGVAIVGIVAGLESSVVAGPEDLAGVARKLAPFIALAFLAGVLRRRS
jgi:hypothetical protein